MCAVESGEHEQQISKESTMHKRTSGLILVGLLVGGVGGAVAVTPASATTSDNVVTSRLAGIKSALSGLVSDGTLTQKQADKVAGTLNSKLPMRGPGGMGRMGGMVGPGGHMGGMRMAQTQEAVAKALGMTTDKLNAALAGGKSLADVAKDQKVSVDSLVKVMVTAAESQLATAVKQGHLTQAMADRMKSSLTQRITAHVNGVRPDHGLRSGAGHGPGDVGSSSPSGTTTGGTASTPLSTV
jgi:hypothetical protein